MAKNYAEQMQEEKPKAPGYINIKGVIPKGGSVEDAVGIRGQGRVSFPLESENELHAKLLQAAANSETGTHTIILVAEVRNVEAAPQQDISGLEF